MRAQLGTLCVVMRKYNLQYTVYAIHYIPDLLAHEKINTLHHTLCVVMRKYKVQHTIYTDHFPQKSH